MRSITLLGVRLAAHDLQSSLSAEQTFDARAKQRMAHEYDDALHSVCFLTE